ncbi:MAG: hypothetical protein JNM56_40900 [Planctomycetia bacterium]|nr:hypothetical protein [Planctomycetia bacterium]
MMKQVTYGQLRAVLEGIGFAEDRRANGVALEHRDSDTIFLFRPYQPEDAVRPADVFVVQKLLDERGLLEPTAFEALLTKAPA